MKLRFFREQRRAITLASELIEQLPEDMRWMLAVSEEHGDAQLNIWVQPGEIDDFRRVLGLSNYTFKVTDCVTYHVGPLAVSLIEGGNDVRG